MIKITILEKQHIFKGFLSFPIQTADANMKAYRRIGPGARLWLDLAALSTIKAMRACWVSGSWINLPSSMSKSHSLSLRKMRGWQGISCKHSKRASVSRVPGSALCQRSGANQPRCLVTQLNNKQFQGQRWVWAHWGPSHLPAAFEGRLEKRALVCQEGPCLLGACTWTIHSSGLVFTCSKHSYPHSCPRWTENRLLQPQGRR